MINTQLTLRVSLLASAFLWSAGAATANIDPFSSCADSCRLPGPCQEATVAAQCQKMCKDDSMWKQAARLQLGRSSKEFRIEKDPKKKEGMLPGSPIGQCLGLTAKEAVKEKEPGKTGLSSLRPAGMPAPAAKAHGSSVHDLCAAAIKKEMGDLERGKAALETQNKNLGAALKAMEDASAK